MSNNISRKGLALGALFAIGASLFAGAPAHAAVGVTLAANSTSQVLSVPTGTSFQLIETASSEIPDTSYKTLAVSVTPLEATGADNSATVTVGARTQKTVTSGDARDGVVFKASDLVAALGAGHGNNITVEIRGNSASTHSYKVTTWLDADGSNTVNNGEYSATQTVTFLGAADLTATTSFVKVPTYTSDTRSIQVRTELTNVNNDQVALSSNSSLGSTYVAGKISIDLRSGTYDARLVPSAAAAAGVVVSGDNRYYANTGTNANPNNAVDISLDGNVWYSGAVFTAQAYWGTTALGSAVTSTTGLINNAATGIYVGIIEGDNAVKTDLVNNTVQVRTNSAFQVSGTIRGDAGSNLTGVGIKFSVSQANWETSSIRVSVNGNVYTTSADLRAASWTLPADANGNAILNVVVSGSNQSNGKNDLIFAVSSANATGVKAVTAQQTDAVASSVSATPASQAVVIGSAANVVATVKDQFGVALNYPGVVAVTYKDGKGSVASNTNANLVNGSATLPVTVDGTSTGTTRYDVTATVVNKDGSTTSNAAVVTIATRSATDLVVGYLVKVATLSTHVSVDTKALAGTAGGSNSAAQVTGRAVITNDRGVAYAAITVAGAGLFVNVNGKYAAAPATVNADVDGYFTISVRTNTAGTLAGTVASGSAAAKDFNVVADLAGSTAGVSIDAPADYKLLANNSTAVTFSARDLFNNNLGVDLNGNTSETLTVHVSGDITRDAIGVDSKGFLTVSSLSAAAGKTAYVTATYSTSARLITKQVRVDWLAETVTVDAPEAATAGQNVDVVVTVLDPNGDPVKGYDITATSSGVGNLTVATAKTDANGQAYLKLFAAAGELGWAYVTATSTTGSVVADVAGIQFQAAPTATDSVATLTLDAPASAQAGTVVDVTATATDADGNAVAGAVVSATSTGVGYLAVASGTTDADGKVTLKLVVTAGENGTASVSATSGDATADAATVTAGATDANITLAKKRVTVDWSFAANKKVVIVRDGAVIKSFTASSNAADSFSFNLKKGTHKVSVKVGGVTLDSASYKIAK